MKTTLKKYASLLAALPLLAFGFSSLGCDEANDSPAENAAEAAEERTDAMEERADEIEDNID